MKTTITITNDTQCVETAKAYYVNKVRIDDHLLDVCFGPKTAPSFKRSIESIDLPLSVELDGFITADKGYGPKFLVNTFRMPETIDPIDSIAAEPKYVHKIRVELASPFDYQESKNLRNMLFKIAGTGERGVPAAWVVVPNETGLAMLSSQVTQLSLISPTVEYVDNIGTVYLCDKGVEFLCN